jgi:hypothetical protein
VHGAFKLHIRGLMHRNPPDPPRSYAYLQRAQRAPMRLLLSVLPVRRHIRARLVEMHVLVDMIGHISSP